MVDGLDCRWKSGRYILNMHSVNYVHQLLHVNIHQYNHLLVELVMYQVVYSVTVSIEEAT